MISFLPPARPSTPVAVYLNVLPGEARQSIQAFNWLGIPKLYIGAPSTTMSAARNSSSTTLVSANSACVDASTLAPPLHGGVSWYVMMGVGQVVTLRVPPDGLREVNRVIEDTAWGGYRTEFYPTYDYKQLAEQERKKAE